MIVNQQFHWKTQYRVGAELSQRQREILVGLAMDKTMLQVADELKISVKTVEYHRAQLLEKIGVMGLAGLAREAIRMGLVPNPCDRYNGIFGPRKE